MIVLHVIFLLVVAAAWVLVAVLVVEGHRAGMQRLHEAERHWAQPRGRDRDGASWEV